MRRFRFMLVALLSVLGLTAADFSYSDAASQLATNVCPALVSSGSDEQGKHSPEKDFSSNDRIARGLNRRAGVQPGSERLASSVADSGLQFVQPERPRFIFNGTERSLELARCWQFHWRTACEPRAPSTVS